MNAEDLRNIAEKAMEIKKLYNIKEQEEKNIDEVVELLFPIVLKRTLEILLNAAENGFLFASIFDYDVDNSVDSKICIKMRHYLNDHNFTTKYTESPESPAEDMEVRKSLIAYW